MRAYKNKVNPDQIGDIVNYKMLENLVNVFNKSIENGRGRLIIRSIRLIQEYNTWINMIENKMIIVNAGMFYRELKWYENRSLGCLGESYLRNYVKARARKLSKKLFVSFTN